MFKKRRVKKIYDFIYRLARINKKHYIDFMVVGSSSIFFGDKNFNPGDLDIFFRNVEDMEILLNNDNFGEINNNNMSLNISLNEYLASLEKYTIKYYGLHIDLLISSIFELDFNFIFKYSKEIPISSDLKIRVPIDEMLFILKSIKINEISNNYGNKINRSQFVNIKSLVYIHEKIDIIILKEIIEKLPKISKYRVINILRLIESNREDILRIKKDLNILRYDTQKYKNYNNFISSVEKLKINNSEQIRVFINQIIDLINLNFSQKYKFQVKKLIENNKYYGVCLLIRENKIFNSNKAGELIFSFNSDFNSFFYKNSNWKYYELNDLLINYLNQKNFYNFFIKEKNF